MKPNLTIKGLKVSIEDKEILKGIDLEIKGGEVHAIMGPNGTGKSTLSKAIMGHPSYEITDGSIVLNEEDVLEMEVDERARAGLFLAMQHPVEISGVNNDDFVFQAMNKRLKKKKSRVQFGIQYEKAFDDLNMNPELKLRYLNENFSGGEKKRNEILQMKLLKPQIAILDEIDSGLDVDALRDVGNNVSAMVNDNFGCLLITHYQRLLDHIKPDYLHIMIDGKIVKTGGPELIKKIDEDGYNWVREELGIDFDDQPQVEERVVLGNCAVSETFNEE